MVFKPVPPHLRPGWTPTTGPHPIVYETNTKKRCEKRNERRKTLFSKSFELAIISGGKTFAMYEDDNQQIWFYCTDARWLEKYNTTGLRRADDAFHCDERGKRIDNESEDEVELDDAQPHLLVEHNGDTMHGSPSHSVQASDNDDDSDESSPGIPEVVIPVNNAVFDYNPIQKSSNMQTFYTSNGTPVQASSIVEIDRSIEEFIQQDKAQTSKNPAFGESRNVNSSSMLNDSTGGAGCNYSFPADPAALMSYDLSQSIHLSMFDGLPSSTPQSTLQTPEKSVEPQGQPSQQNNPQLTTLVQVTPSSSQHSDQQLHTLNQVTPSGIASQKTKVQLSSRFPVSTASVNSVISPTYTELSPMITSSIDQKSNNRQPLFVLDYRNQHRDGNGVESNQIPSLSKTHVSNTSVQQHEPSHGVNVESGKENNPPGQGSNTKTMPKQQTGNTETISSRALQQLDVQLHSPRRSRSVKSEGTTISSFYGRDKQPAVQSTKRKATATRPAKQTKKSSLRPPVPKKGTKTKKSSEKSLHLKAVEETVKMARKAKAEK